MHASSEPGVQGSFKAPFAQENFSSEMGTQEFPDQNTEPRLIISVNEIPKIDTILEKFLDFQPTDAQDYSH